MKVRATKDFYTVDGTLHKVGDVFEVINFNADLMEKVNEKKSKTTKETEDVSED